MPYDVRLRAYEPDGPAIGFLPEPLSLDASLVHNDAGALSLTYSSLAAGGETLTRGLEQGLEVAVEVSNGGAWVEPLGARFVLIKRDRDHADVQGVVRLVLPSYGWLLSKARNMETANLLPEDHSQAGRRPFYSDSAGIILGTLLDENATRDGVPVARTWTDGQDSAGAAWAKVATLYYDLGIALDAILANLSAQGMCDWRTDARALRLFNADSPATSADVSDVVRLWLGTDVLDAPSDESLEEVVSRVLIRGDDGLVLTEDNPAAPTPWGQWEGYISQGGVSDEGTARVLVQTELARAARVRGQYTRALVLAGDVKHAPLIDYAPGSWITAPTTGSGERVRVQQVTLTKGPDGVGGSVVLNDRVLDRELRQARRVQGITGGSSASGGSGGPGPRPAPDGPDTRTPAAPEGLTVITDAYIDSRGIAQGTLEIAWGEVTTATDGTLLDVSTYDVAMRENVVGAPWITVVSTDDTEATRSTEQVGKVLQVKVRARGRYATTPGQWCDPVTLTVARDTTPPPAPSDPLTASRLGQVTVTWDGLTATATDMPLDFDRVDVYQQGTAEAIGVLRRGSGNDFMVVTDLPYNQEYRYRFVAVDRSGNASAASAWVPVTVTPLVDLDLEGTTVEAQIEAVEADAAAAQQAAADAQAAAQLAQETADAASSQASNVVTNGSFEDATGTGWNIPSRASIVARSDAAQGARVLRVTTTGSGDIYASNAELAPTAPGRIWRFMVWARQGGTAATSGGPSMFVRTASGGVYSQTGLFTIPLANLQGSGWVSFIHYYTVPAGVDAVGPYFGAWGQVPAGAVVELDNVTMQDVTEAREAIALAEDAAAQAEAAAVAAGNAQTAADGKSVVWYQAGAPSGSSHGIGDTWFDTDAGNAIHRWNGSAWIAAQLGTNAIANLSITNALIANGAIQNAKIANLDAAKITTGTLDAARIAAKSITADKVIIGSSTNLVANGGAEEGSSLSAAGWVPSGVAFTATAHTGSYAYHFTTGSPSLRSTSPIEVQPGDVLRLRAWVRNYAANATGTAGGFRIRYEGGADVTSGVWSGTQNFSNLGTGGGEQATWVLREATWAATEIARVNLVFAFAGLSSALQIDDIEVVRMADSTLIVDGAVIARTIAAEAITAPKIAANAITADKISVGAIDGMVITGAVIRTASSGDRLELSGTTFKAISGGNNAVEINPTGILVNDNGGLKVTGSGSIIVDDGGALVARYFTNRDAMRIGKIADGLYGFIMEGDTTADGGILRAYWYADGTYRKQVWVGHEDSPAQFVAYTDNTWIYASNPNGLINLAGRGTGGVLARGLSENGQVLRAEMSLQTTWARLLHNGANGSNNSGIQCETDGVKVFGAQNTSAAANMRLTNGFIQYNTSSLRYKQDVEMLDMSAVRSDTILAALAPRTWRDKAELERDPGSTARYVGTIAEVLDEAGLNPWVEYDDDGLPNALAYDRLAVLLAVVVQRQQDQIDALTQHITTEES